MSAGNPYVAKWHKFANGKWAVKGPASIVRENEYVEVYGKGTPTRVYILKTSKCWKHKDVLFTFGYPGLANNDEAISGGEPHLSKAYTSS